ncbi:MAG: Gx transporter family protein [Desulfuromonadales bacterium]|nr:Gx transporter family protein [Desulfuromonadales bacterium]
MTCSAAKEQQLEQARRHVFLALLIAVAISIHTVESLLPTPLPWLRLGLANSVAVVALYLYGPRAAWSVNLARVGLGALLLGRLFSPGFWLALAGCLVATSLMVGLHRRFPDWLTPIGVSVAGAAGHAFGQLLAARLLLVSHDAIWQVLPALLMFSLGAGIVTGWVALRVLREIRRHPLFRQLSKAEADDQTGEQALQ